VARARGKLGKPVPSPNIREAEAIAQVVRVFDDPDVIHVEGAVDPAADMETINTELMLADLQTLDKAIVRYEKEVKGKKMEPAVLASAVEAKGILDGGVTLFQAGFDSAPLRELGLLTAKPFLYVFNVDESTLGNPARCEELAALVAPAKAVFLDAKVESELIDLDAGEAAELLASMGQEESGLDQLARIGFVHPRFADLFDRRPQRSPCLDDSPGLESTPGCRCDPHRL